MEHITHSGTIMGHHDIGNNYMHNDPSNVITQHHPVPTCGNVEPGLNLHHNTHGNVIGVSYGGEHGSFVVDIPSNGTHNMVTSGSFCF